MSLSQPPAWSCCCRESARITALPANVVMIQDASVLRAPARGPGRASRGPWCLVAICVSQLNFSLSAPAHSRASRRWARLLVSRKWITSSGRPNSDTILATRQYSARIRAWCGPGRYDAVDDCVRLLDFVALIVDRRHEDLLDLCEQSSGFCEPVRLLHCGRAGSSAIRDSPSRKRDQRAADSPTQIGA